MTLEEAIKHEEEIVKEEQYEYQECVATHNTEGAMNCRKYAEEHRQLAKWLKDYKRLLEQEPKTGHWIRITDNAGHLVWECDNCGWQQRYNTNFCPDCGIRMESEG